MSDLLPSFDDSEMAALDEIGRRLRAQGWADHVTVYRLLSSWREVASTADHYHSTIDDYTNDVTSRDGIELVLAACAPPLRDKLLHWVEATDGEFVARTIDDPGEAIGRYYRLDEASGWWWRRKPERGPLADYLAGSET